MGEGLKRAKKAAADSRAKIWDGAKEIARLRADQDALYKALKGMLRVCPSERGGMKLAEYEAAREVIRRLEAGQPASSQIGR